MSRNCKLPYSMRGEALYTNSHLAVCRSSEGGTGAGSRLSDARQVRAVKE
jgi:hypothetical protein